jgi:hypothetical protein
MELLLEAGVEAVEIFWGFKAGDFSAHRRIQVQERVAFPFIGTVSGADGPI